MPGDQRTRSAGSWTAFYKKTVAIMLLAVVVSSAQAQPAADYIVTIKNHEVAVLDVKAVEQIAVADMRRMPDNRNDLRSFVLGFMREVAEHYHDNHAMFTIITDEYSSPLEYKAFVKRFTPKDVTAVIPPRKP